MRGCFGQGIPPGSLPSYKVCVRSFAKRRLSAVAGPEDFTAYPFRGKMLIAIKPLDFIFPSSASAFCYKNPAEIIFCNITAGA
jgi:hypothetical protein